MSRAQLDQIAALQIELETVKKQLAVTHLALIPFRAVCGADERGQRTTDDAAKVTCAKCLRDALAEQLAKVAEFEREQREIDAFVEQHLPDDFGPYVSKLSQAETERDSLKAQLATALGERDMWEERANNPSSALQLADAEKVMEAARRGLRERGRVDGIDHAQTILNRDIDAMEHALHMFDAKWRAGK